MGDTPSQVAGQRASNGIAYSWFAARVALVLLAVVLVGVEATRLSTARPSQIPRAGLSVLYANLAIALLLLSWLAATPLAVWLRWRRLASEPGRIRINETPLFTIPLAAAGLVFSIWVARLSIAHPELPGRAQLSLWTMTLVAFVPLVEFPTWILAEHGLLRVQEAGFGSIRWLPWAIIHEARYLQSGDGIEIWLESNLRPDWIFSSHRFARSLLDGFTASRLKTSETDLASGRTLDFASCQLSAAGLLLDGMVVPVDTLSIRASEIELRFAAGEDPRQRGIDDQGTSNLRLLRVLLERAGARVEDIAPAPRKLTLGPLVLVGIPLALAIWSLQNGIESACQWSFSHSILAVAFPALICFGIALTLPSRRFVLPRTWLDRVLPYASIACLQLGLAVIGLALKPRGAIESWLYRMTASQSWISVAPWAIVFGFLVALCVLSVYFWFWVLQSLRIPICLRCGDLATQTTLRWIRGPSRRLSHVSPERRSWLQSAVSQLAVAGRSDRLDAALAVLDQTDRSLLAYLRVLLNNCPNGHRWLAFSSWGERDGARGTQEM